MQDDMIPPHQHIDAESVSHAVDLLDEHGRQATVVAGGTDEFEWIKNRSRDPEVVVDIKHIDDISGIEEDDGGLRIGANTRLSEILESDLFTGGFSIIQDATADVATPQIQYQGTIGGNLAQDSRCWYYREDFACYRAGGTTCYAATGDAREHAITDYSRCITANPSDIAPALIALNAEVVIQGRRGERRQKVRNFFVGPETNITKMTTLGHREILKEIVIPDDFADAAVYWEKTRDRQAWDFALVNVAGAFNESGGEVDRARIVTNGVAPKPKRMSRAEDRIEGRSRSDENAEDAADRVLRNADPFDTNEYKVPLTKNLVRNAIAHAE